MSEDDALRYFKEITKVPRPSGHTGRIGEYLKRFAESKGLQFVQDGFGNVIIRRPGKTPYVTLQAHQDMVPTCLPGMGFDFVDTPLDTFEDNGWIRARGTTLGADDGAGIAVAMCALTDPSLEGCSIEALFTVDEEVGILGAARMERDSLLGRYLVNIDSEDVREITIGCAGSTDMTATFKGSLSPVSGFCYHLAVSGCSGGHSAGEIDKDRVNAIILAASTVRDLGSGVRIGSFNGGNASNAIPMSCEVDFCTSDPIDDNIRDDICRRVVSDARPREPGIVVELERIAKSQMFDAEFSSRLLCAIMELPNGVLGKDRFGVMTSSNVGLVRTDGESVSVTVKPRSSDTGALTNIIGTQSRIFTGAGATIESPDPLPAWHEDPESPLVKVSVSVYRRVFGSEPVVTVTHGGLECSVIRERNSGLEGAVSVGPTILGAHSPQERMDISTLISIRRYVFELVKDLCYRLF